jgi:hypothetical protein
MLHLYMRGRIVSDAVSTTDKYHARKRWWARLAILL